MRFTLLLLVTILSIGGPCKALERLDGYFTASKACPAFLSKNRMTNPGAVETEPAAIYEVVGINKVGGDFFRIRVPGAPVTVYRWVHVGCGVHAVGEPASDVPGRRAAMLSQVAESADHLLALSWQPAFCETEPDKIECKRLNGGLLPVAEKQLSIHGLWPQPHGNVYCDVPPELVDFDKSGQWHELPEPQLDAATRNELAVAMPGTASFLDRHEWIKHGTCHFGKGGADEYYDDTLHLVDAINASSIATYLADRVGVEISTEEIRDRFDAEFGAGAGNRVQFHCTGDGGRVLIQELKINLRGVIGPGSRLASLLQDADPVSIGCRKGVIDAVGLQ